MVRAVPRICRLAADLRSSIWKQMAAAGIKYIPSNTFSYYDQVLDTTTMIGAVPPRFNWNSGEIGFDTYFSMASGSTPTRALEELDNSIFQGRLLHIMPAKQKVAPVKAHEEWEKRFNGFWVFGV
ncbi:putative 5-methyltetrahydropteroyltriglutamate--homocysteine S-methyltransferase [Helianthus annuus]|uniref:5-methyltetrahydropteroyltriglutamate--homocysteine S-methyltransferase n=2 Tax=Helianthus annuus TaxID=4232 RepID=A0A9K3HX00_HELAN|nr:putative 5-methyltetrahydropteroyltriglutamate--homocysteine S-methyltransferase [Helianthus annuus]KAJ0513561.1 putative 5-methyltetrahydropteroyltriglutamate--homocysteine S-methyltransferase [Helianthus annuus]KAJ0521425.1 putative 5-methyltetrahydropteroyltriglutamate--homocysteine S-methyltransferase [Helianthus annuus]KAJ0529675.1 putative 5-methyltetrahydropteroyltriglutamate--homocysteine S-methyltransferase [Helianthus annuus]KAJ0696531.1 putative 5-methyltetrahydropteroyltriglutama